MAKAQGKDKEEIAKLQNEVNAWDEGGSNKILLHSIIGGIMADLGGGNALSGAVGAGINEAVQKQLDKIDDPGLHQMASALLGGTVGKLITGDAGTGASTAASGTKNNELKDIILHPIEVGEGITEGLKDQGIETIMDIVEIIQHPVDTVLGIKEMLNEIQDDPEMLSLIGSAVVEDLKERLNKITDGTAYETGYEIGRVTVDVATIMAGTGLGSKMASKVPGLENIISKLSTNLGSIKNIPIWKGSGPAPGVLGVNRSSQSVQAIKNYYPSQGGIEFVFDPKTNTFVVGKAKEGLFSGSAHQQLAKSIDADESIVVGGTFSRGKNGEIFTTENSGHYGQNWSTEVRKQFEKAMDEYGLTISHQKWSE